MDGFGGPIIFQKFGVRNAYFSSLGAPKGYFKQFGVQNAYFSEFGLPKAYFKQVWVQKVHSPSFCPKMASLWFGVHDLELSRKKIR